MKTKQVAIGNKRMLSMNIDRQLYHRAKVFAAESEITTTSLIEHLIDMHLNGCKHFLQKEISK